jgi:DNA-binding MarR family transcriptional regulator
LTPAERRVWRAALAVADILRFQVNEEMKPVSDLSSADHRILLRLDEAPGECMGQQRLADAMLWSKSRLSHQLKRMAARGLIERATAADGRGVEVFLTEAGKQVVREVEIVHANAVRRHLFEVATENELNALMQLAERLAYGLDTNER